MINGKWYPKGSAVQQGASLSIQNKTFCVSIEGQRPLSGDIASIKVSDRIGRTERKLTLPDGSVFATADNEAVDRLMIPQSRIKRAIHYLESHLIWVLCSGILIVFLSFAFIRWGLPVVSHQIAQILPQKTSEVIGQQSFAFIDKYFLAESRLSSQRKVAIRERFQTKLIPSQKTSKIHYTLHFREWLIDDVSIPNAFALP
ncbi:MAG: peptidase M48 Ste24p, partial [Thiotrichales bacterium]